MIPQQVYDNILYAYNVCHGARLTRLFKGGERIYHLEKGRRDGSFSAFVKASLFVHVKTDIELDRYEAQGYDVFRNSVHSTPFAVKPIALGQVPDSEVSEWKQWDEY